MEQEKSPRMALGQTGLLPHCFSFAQWYSETGILLITREDTRALLSFLSFLWKSQGTDCQVGSFWISGQWGWRGSWLFFFPFYISDLALKIKERIRFPVQPQLIVQQGRDRVPFLPGNTGGCPVHSLRFRFGTGGASGFSFQILVSSNPFPDMLIFL